MKKKYLFVHIAKAAGSSVNKFFMDALGRERCAVHLESNPQWQTEEGRAKILAKHDYLSGHLVYWDFKSKVDLSQFNVFTFLRDPREHVISHLAWIRHIADPGQEKRFDAHPEYIQRLAKKLSQVDFLDRQSVSSFVDNLTPVELALLDNPQTRYLRSGRNRGAVNADDVSDAVQALQEIDAFGLVDRINSDLDHVAKLGGVAANIFSLKENVLTEKYGMSLQDAGLFNALNQLIRFDLALYEKAIGLKSAEIVEKTLLNNKNQDFVYRLDKLHSDIVAGWIKTASNQPTSDFFDVLVNGLYVGQVCPNKSRPDLIMAFGFGCAFNHKFKKDVVLKDGDLLSFVNARTHVVLFEKNIKL
ncbi:hypothetical protein [Macromonas bipunctata]|uniref:hypothetical protein n=1 Tax=Macromonas bipunctata TaxID=183670 RepID=UPI0011AF5060|nr:hypothetical protein [Macromonas bipunctata]